MLLLSVIAFDLFVLYHFYFVLSRENIRKIFIFFTISSSLMPKSPHSGIFLHKAFLLISLYNTTIHKKEVYIITMETNHTHKIERVRRYDEKLIKKDLS
jgi:hypothetical protein